MLSYVSMLYCIPFGALQTTPLQKTNSRSVKKHQRCIKTLDIAICHCFSNIYQRSTTQTNTFEKVSHFQEIEVKCYNMCKYYSQSTEQRSFQIRYPGNAIHTARIKQQQQPLAKKNNTIVIFKETANYMRLMMCNSFIIIFISLLLQQ